MDKHARTMYNERFCSCYTVIDLKGTV